MKCFQTIYICTFYYFLVPSLFLSLSASVVLCSWRVSVPSLAPAARLCLPKPFVTRRHAMLRHRVDLSNRRFAPADLNLRCATHLRSYVIWRCCLSRPRLNTAAPGSDLRGCLSQTEVKSRQGGTQTRPERNVFLRGVGAGLLLCWIL